MPTGFADLDQLTNGLHPRPDDHRRRPPGDRASRRWRLDFSRACSIKHGLTVGDLLAGDEQAPRSPCGCSRPRRGSRCTTCGPGTMSDDDWTRLARRMGEVARRAALHRRLAEPDDDGDPGQGPPAASSGTTCKLVIVDYLQLMTAASGWRAGSRRSREFSRQLKLLAKELEVPGRRDQPAEPRSRAAHRQEADALRPARVGLDRAGRGHGDPAAPRGLLRAGVAAGRRGRPDRGQAPQRADRPRSRSPSRATTPASSTWPPDPAGCRAAAVPNFTAAS